MDGTDTKTRLESRLSTMPQLEYTAQEDIMLPLGTVTKMAREYGKSTKELREAILIATTLFLHYVAGHAVDSIKERMIKEQWQSATLIL
jgi:hypothetical protein